MNEGLSIKTIGRHFSSLAHSGYPDHSIGAVAEASRCKIVTDRIIATTISLKVIYRNISLAAIDIRVRHAYTIADNPAFSQPNVLAAIANTHKTLMTQNATNLSDILILLIIYNPVAARSGLFEDR